MSTLPELTLATDTVTFGRDAEPLLVDPDPPLLTAVVAAWRRASPDVLEPRAPPEVGPLAGDGGGYGPGAGTGSGAGDGSESIPTLTVLARPSVLSAVTDGFHAASRLAGLVESGAVVVRTLAERQPTAVLALVDDGFSVVETDDGHYRVGSDPSLRERYASVVADADDYKLRTPGRRRIHDAFRDRCGEAVAEDVLRLLDADPELADGDAVSPRIRPYLVGARHGVLHYQLRRAGEEAGLGSPSTFSKVKSRLVDAELLTTKKVDQPVGRPRQRLVACEALAAASPTEAVDVARERLAE